MSLIEKFKEKVLNSQDSFVITDSRKGSYRVYYFVQGNAGKARYVYGYYSYRNANFCSGIKNELKLLAIIRDGKIYVCDEFFFDIWQCEYNGILLPEAVFKFTGIVRRANDYVRDVVFPEFYSGLEVCEDADIDLDRYVPAARKIIFFGMDSAGIPEYQDMFSEQDIADMLCGFMDFDKETGKRLGEEKDKWLKKKAINMKIQELIESPEIALPCEKAIADGLRSVTAKMVVAEFKVGDKKSAAKICPDIIINKMISNNYFDYYNFITDKKGLELFEELDVDINFGSKKSLTCNDISKITYGRKELYVRAG